MIRVFCLQARRNHCCDGMLNNQFYVGKRVWSRRSWKRDSSTHNRNYRDTARSTWKVAQMPELRIIEDDLWVRIKQVQESASVLSGK